jgi:hypothetical protein
VQRISAGALHKINLQIFLPQLRKVSFDENGLLDQSTLKR